jgi:hypothetical protein
VSTDPFAVAVQLGIIAYISGKLSDARKNDLGPAATQALPVGTRLPIKIGDDLIGWLSIPQPRKGATVTGEAQFLAWARDNAPTEVVTVEQVRPSFASLVLESVKKNGGWLDKSDGEYKPVPGVTASEGDPYPKVDLSGDAGAVIAAAWRDGQVDIRQMLALPAAEGDEAA